MYIVLIFFLIFLSDFIIVTINLIQLLAAILIGINYLSIYAGILVKNIPQEVRDSADEDEREVYNPP